MNTCRLTVIGMFLVLSVAQTGAFQFATNNFSNITTAELRAEATELHEEATEKEFMFRGAAAVLERAKEQKVDLDMTCRRIVNDTLETFLKGTKKTAKRARVLMDELKRRNPSLNVFDYDL